MSELMAGSTIYWMHDHPYLIRVVESRIHRDRLVLDLELFYVEAGLAIQVMSAPTLRHPKINEFVLDCVASEHAKHGMQIEEQVKIEGPPVRHSRDSPNSTNSTDIYTIQYVKTTKGMCYARVILPDGSEEIHSGEDFNHINGISAVERDPNDPINGVIKDWCRDARRAFERSLQEPIPRPDNI